MFHILLGAGAVVFGILKLTFDLDLFSETSIKLI